MRHKPLRAPLKDFLALSGYNRILACRAERPKSLPGPPAPPFQPGSPTCAGVARVGVLERWVGMEKKFEPPGDATDLPHPFAKPRAKRATRQPVLMYYRSFRASLALRSLFFSWSFKLRDPARELSYTISLCPEKSNGTFDSWLNKMTSLPIASARPTS